MQKFKFSLVLPFIAILAYPVVGYAQNAAKVECKTGPITRSYGGTDWQLYSCNDGFSLAFQASPNSPASPAYFVITPQDGRYHLVGKSKGDAAATKAAIGEIQNLSKDDVAQLIASTKAGSQGQ